MSKKEIKGFDDCLAVALGVEKPFLYIFYRTKDENRVMFDNIRFYGRKELIESISLDFMDFGKDLILFTDFELKLNLWLRNNALRAYQVVYDIQLPKHGNFKELFEQLKKGNANITYEKKISINGFKRKRENSEYIFQSKGIS